MNKKDIIFQICIQSTAKERGYSLVELNGLPVNKLNEILSYCQRRTEQRKQQNSNRALSQALYGVN